jgi:hypothetical protein
MDVSRTERKNVKDVRYMPRQMTKLKVSYSSINNFKECSFIMRLLSNNIERELRLPIFDEKGAIGSYYFVKILISSTLKNNGNIIVRVTDHNKNKNYDLPVQNAQEICDNFFDNNNVSAHMQTQRVMNLVIDSVTFEEIENVLFDSEEAQQTILNRMNSYNNQQVLLAAKLFQI